MKGGHQAQLNWTGGGSIALPLPALLSKQRVAFSIHLLPLQGAIVSSFFQMLQTLLVCLTVLGLAWVVALSLPKSRARTVLTEVVSWGFLAFCTAYTVSPLDILPEAVLGPFGFVDDLGAVFLGYQSFQSAMQARRERQYLD